MGDDRPLLARHALLAAQLPWVRLGDFPTPVRALDGVADRLGLETGILWEKRDDLTSPIYGGNKVRTLEVLFGDAVTRGATHVYSTGAYGSNHGAATVLHAPRADLRPGSMLYPQPPSRCAADNLAVMLSQRPVVKDLPHYTAFPLGWLQLPGEARARGERPYIMEPGGAVPLGALGYVSAAWELAHQVEAGLLPRPRVLVVPAGSNCTTAGLLLGLRYAAEAGVGFVEKGAPAPPVLWAVRVTPWPVTMRYRITRLAAQASALLAERAQDASLERSSAVLSAGLHIDGRYLGAGYGLATEAGRAAVARWADDTDHPLETTYSGKGAAAFIDFARTAPRGPILFWSTKSSAPLPPIDPDAVAEAPPRMRRWLAKAMR